MEANFSEMDHLKTGQVKTKKSVCLDKLKSVKKCAWRVEQPPTSRFDTDDLDASQTPD